MHGCYALDEFSRIDLFALVNKDCMKRIGIPLQDTFYRLTLDRSFKSNNAAIAKTAKTTNATEPLVLQAVLLRVTDIRQHCWNATFRNSDSIIKEYNLPFFGIYRYLNLALILLKDSGLNSRVNCICSILHILTIEEQGIVVHPLRQRLNDVLAEYWFVIFKHFNTYLALPFVIQALHNI